MTDVLGGAAHPETTFLSAVKWSYVMDGGRQIMTTVIAFFLAILLGPETLGISAMALAYVLFIQMLQTQGLAAALIQRKNLSDSHLHTAFWGLLAVSGVLTLVSLVLAGWWADVNEVALLKPVIMVLSIMVPLQGLIIVQEAVMRRALDFKSLALRSNIAVLVSGVSAVALALADAGVWALVVQQIVSASIGLALLWRLGPYRPQFHFSREAMRDLMGFSSLTFVATLAVFLGTRADVIIIGFFFGPTAAGIYYFANRLITVVVDVSSRGLQGVSLPELSRHQSDPTKVADRMLTILGVSALVSFPALALLGGASAEIVALLGEREWSAAVTVIRLLVIVGAIRALTVFTGPLLQALGRPGLLAAMSWTVAIMNAVGLAIAGALTKGAAFEDRVFALVGAQVIVYTLVLGLYLLPIFWFLRVRPTQLASILVGPVAAAVAGFLALWLTGSTLAGASVLIRFALESLAGVAAIGATMFLFRDRVRLLVSSLGG